MIETNTYTFRIINGVYPDLDNYRFYITVPDIGITLIVVEQWATGKLYVTIDGSDYQIPLRYNTNILPSAITDKNLYYDFNRQAFILEEKL